MKINFQEISDFNQISDNDIIICQKLEDIKQSNNNLIKKAKENYDFSGKKGEICNLSYQEKNIILIGLGKKSDLNNNNAKEIGGLISSYVNAKKIKSSSLIISNDISDDIINNLEEDSEIISNIVFGITLKNYRFNKYFNDKKKSKTLSAKNINIIVNDHRKSINDFKSYQLIAENIFFARDLTSEPSNELNPESYAAKCKELTEFGLEVEILDEEKMRLLGMKALLGVGQGSAYGSKLVILKWNGAKDNSKPLAFVGKGVTFDTGGISIKPSNNMEDMKTDMGGSAVVVSLLKLLAQRKAKVNAVGVVGLVENMPSSTAQKPGDVVTSMSGQTIEIINTDAEGRLVLADALHYTNETFKPEFIIDLATLTGAIIVCLADIYGGLFANDDKFAQKLITSGEKSGEKLWQMPIGNDYDKMINSDIADMKNVGAGRGAGSTTAAQFLKRFIGKTKWAHLDIAGVAWKGKGDPTSVKGATGFGVALLNQFVKDNYEK
jgi:leucyl aminopeptidase